MEKTGVTGEKKWTCLQFDKLKSQSCIKYTSPWTEIKLATLATIANDCRCRCKFTYHMVAETTATHNLLKQYQKKIESFYRTEHDCIK